MKDKLLVVVMCVTLTLGIIGIVWLTALNFRNPDFTELRMLIEFWPIYGGTGMSIAVAAICADALKW